MKDPTEERTIPYRTFFVNVAYTLLKNKVAVVTDDYTPILTEDGRIYEEDTNSTNWEQAYETSHYTIMELLDELKKYIDREMSMVVRDSIRYRELKQMRHDLQDWVLEEKHYEEG